VALRGEEHRAAIRAVLSVFGEDAAHFVFVGGCTLGLYATSRSLGAPLRATKDVDCISTRQPWVLQEETLARLCTEGRISPQKDLQCRYRICGTDYLVDVLSPEGANVGGVNVWFERAAARAAAYDVGDGIRVMAVTPPYFLATKLVAFEDRGPDVRSSVDCEDIVTLVVEIEDLLALVDAEGMRADVAVLWKRIFAKYAFGIDDLPDVVDGHLDAREREHRARIVQTLEALARG
jgi:predicted nucleotidyltransferase